MKNLKNTKKEQQLKYCYHTHTFRCGHAFGEDEEYVKKAIECGINRLGFSDHVFLPNEFPQKGVRRTVESLDDYLSSISSLKDKYSKIVKICVGFEAEYYPNLVEYYRWLLNGKVDYLIMGQHCFYHDGHFEWYFDNNSSIERVKMYVDDVIAGLKTGLFSYLAHPDLFMHSQKTMTKELEVESRRLLKACEEMDIPIEINICGMRKPGYNEVNNSYPNFDFFKLSKDYKLRYVIGVDAHDPSHFNKDHIDAAIDFCNRVGINIDWDYII